MTTSEFIKQKMKSENMSGYGLSKKTGLAEGVISDVINNNGASVDTFVALCNGLQVSGDEFENFIKTFNKKERKSNKLLK